MNNTTETEFVVRTAAANMPASCWGVYRRVAVIEVVKGTVLLTISTRVRGVKNIVMLWEKCNVDNTARCAYRKALAEAKAMAAELNAKK